MYRFDARRLTLDIYFLRPCCARAELFRRRLVVTIRYRRAEIMQEPAGRLNRARPSLAPRTNCTKLGPHVPAEASLIPRRRSTVSESRRLAWRVWPTRLARPVWLPRCFGYPR